MISFSHFCLVLCTICTICRFSRANENIQYEKQIFPIRNNIILFEKINNNLYCASHDGYIEKRLLPNDRLMWKTKIIHGEPINILANSTTIIVFGENGEIAAVDSLGKLMWKNQTVGPVTILPMFYNGMVIVYSDNGFIETFNEKTGKRIWSTRTFEYGPRIFGYKQMLILNKLIIIGCAGGHLMFIDADSGKIQWEVPLTSEYGQTSDFIGQINVFKKNVYAVTHGGILGSVNYTSGRLTWLKKLDEEVKLTTFIPCNHAIVLVFTTGKIECISLENETTLWSNDYFHKNKIDIANLTEFFGNILVTRRDGSIYIILGQSGEIIKEFGSDMLLNLNLSISNLKKDNNSVIFQVNQNQHIMPIKQSRIVYLNKIK